MIGYVLGGDEYVVFMVESGQLVDFVLFYQCYGCFDYCEDGLGFGCIFW